MDDGVLRKLHFTILKIWKCILQFVLSISREIQISIGKDFTFVYIWEYWYINYNEYVPGAREEGSHYHWFVVIITSSSSSLSAADAFSSSSWWFKYKFWNLCWKNWMRENEENSTSLQFSISQMTFILNEICKYLISSTRKTHKKPFFYKLNFL